MSYEVQVALEAISSAVSRERLLEIIANNYECALLASANPILSAQDLENLASNVDDELWSLHPDDRSEDLEEQQAIWTLFGVACNPNLPDQTKNKLLLHSNPAALIRFFDHMSESEKDSLPIFQDPILRSFCNQEQKYQELVIEAQSRSTDPGRLVEIFDMELREMVDRSSFSGDFDYYQGFRERQIFTQFAANSDDLSEVLIDGRFVNEEIYISLQANPTLKRVDEYFASTHNIPEFSYLRSVALSNPNYPVVATDDLTRESHDACFWNDYLRYEYHPSLFQFIEDVNSTGYEIDTHWWLSISKAVNAMDTEQLGQVAEVFESMSLVGLGWDDIYWEDQFDDYVAMFMPFLVGSSQEFLEKSFELDSDPIKQAILYNPHSTKTLRDQAKAINTDGTKEDQLFVPSQVDMAKYAAFHGRYELIENWITTPEEMDAFIQSCEPHIVDAISELKLDSISSNAQVVENNHSFESFMLEHYAMNPGLDPKTPLDELRTLAESSDETIQCNVAQNPSAPMEVLRSLAKSSGIAVRSAVASNSVTPGNVLLDLATDSVVKVRIALAGNERVDLEVLKRLASDVDSEVRSTSARNPAVNSELLEVLAKDKDGLVRRNVAKNTSASVEVLAHMTKDNDVWVRRNIASNPSAIDEILISMLNDEDEDVRNRVNSRLYADFDDEFDDEFDDD